MGWSATGKEHSSSGTTSHPVTWVIIGLHGNYDRVTLVLNDLGLAKAFDNVGYKVNYLGKTSVLEVTIDAPANLPVMPGHAIVHAHWLRDWPALKGLWFESWDAHHTRILIRTSGRVPFEVFTGLSPNHNRLVAIDLAHPK